MRQGFIVLERRMVESRLRVLLLCRYTVISRRVLRGC